MTRKDVFFSIAAGSNSTRKNVNLDFNAVQYTVMNVLYPTTTPVEDVVLIWFNLGNEPIAMATNASSNRGAGGPRQLPTFFRGGDIEIRVTDTSGTPTNVLGSSNLAIQIEFSSSLD